MSAKLHIHTCDAPPRQRPVGKLGVVDWREDCSSCHNCVKRSCIYGFYRDEADTLRDELGFLDYIYQCKGCMSCIQDCTKALLTRVVNPEYERLGDDYYTPEIIHSSWYQAETGNVPVSGAGYGGPFSGPGFDSMWTDMSEIVRPTRDGIHGREYISMSVDLGRKLPYLSFERGQLTVDPPPLVELPLPIIFDSVPERFVRGSVVQCIAKAAAEVGTLFVADADGAAPGVSFEDGHIIPLYKTGDIGQTHAAAPMVMAPYSDNVLDLQARVKEETPDRVVAIRIEATPDAARQISQLTRDGAEVIQILFDAHGRETAPSNPRHMCDVIREIHQALVKDGTRDLVTLIASGGIAAAEHVAKAVICGVDLVAIDLPLVIALECRLCGECGRDEECPVGMADIDEALGVQRIVNLIGAWSSQLLELLGAMGIREVRRLRGETGRCMFFDDLEAQTFGRLFGKRKDEASSTV